MKEYSKVNLFIRSCIFATYSTVSITLYSFVMLCSWPFSLDTRYALIRAFIRAYLYVFSKVCMVNYKIEGLENIPKDHAAIVLSKHQSTWETFYIPLIVHNPAMISKSELMWVPFFGWGLAMSKPIWINRSKKSSAMHQIIVQGTQFLKEGRFVVLFPEGTRTAYGTVGNYRLGGTRLAAATGFPILPIAHNAGRHWGRRKFIKTPGTITMVIGPQISPAGKTPEILLEEVKDWIETTMQRIAHT